MKKLFWSLLIIVIVFNFVFLSNVFAQGLLGKRYIGFEVGQVTPGDEWVKDVDDSILFFGGGFNIPLDSNVDFGISIGYSKLEGSWEGVDIESTAKSLIGGIAYQFKPKQQINPYITFTCGIVSTEVELSVPGFSLREKDDDFGFSVGGGIEIELSSQSALRPNIDYVKVGDEDDFFMGLGLNFWFTDSTVGILAIDYGFDEGDLYYGIGIGFGF